MNELEQNELLNRLRKSVLNHLNLSELTDNQLIEEIEKLVLRETKNTFFSIDQKMDFVNYLFSHYRGLGLLDQILDDKEITEVMINGPNDIFIEKNGRLGKLDSSF